jgi:hypothetical protein
MNWIKLIAINVLVFVSILVLTELVLRVGQTTTSCLNANCNLGPISKLKLYRIAKRAPANAIGRFDEQLGQVPKEGFDAVITRDRWDNAKVTITSEGFRDNENKDVVGPSDILVVGDSFTFGAEVSNDKTWPSCLERKLGKGVDNGGVPGYGAALALKRAQQKLSAKDYSTVVLSVLVGFDFLRDRLSYRDGNPRPALIKEGDRIVWSKIADQNKLGTKYNPRSPGWLAFAYERSALVHLIVTKAFPSIDMTGDSLTEAHPRAADKDAIIEWTLKEFSQLNVPRKILLLQYAKNYAKDQGRHNVSEERDLITKAANGLDITVVDTLDELKKYPVKELWKVHHTPRGNEVVCEYLFEKGFGSPM